MALPEVLIVDDDRLLRAMVRDALADVPCRVTEAEDGDEAARRIEASPPAVLILDLVMPGRSGLEILKQLKTGHAAMRIIVVSALDTESLVQQALHDGAHGYLAKPFHPLDVQAVVRAALEGLGAPK